MCRGTVNGCVTYVSSKEVCGYKNLTILIFQLHRPCERKRLHIIEVCVNASLRINGVTCNA